MYTWSYASWKSHSFKDLEDVVVLSDNKDWEGGCGGAPQASFKDLEDVEVLSDNKDWEGGCGGAPKHATKVPDSCHFGPSKQNNTSQFTNRSAVL